MTKSILCSVFVSLMEVGDKKCIVLCEFPTSVKFLQFKALKERELRCNVVFHHARKPENPFTNEVVVKSNRDMVRLSSFKYPMEPVNNNIGE